MEVQEIYDDERDSGSDICGLSLQPKGRVLEGFGYKSSLMNWKTRSIGNQDCKMTIKCETMKMKRCATKCMSEGFESLARLVIWDLSEQD